MPRATPLDRDAMRLPASALVEALEERITRREDLLAERDRRLGKERVRILSYMENIGWPPLFGFDMNRFIALARETLS